MFASQPRTLTGSAIDERLEMWHTEPKVAPLRDFVKRLEARHDALVPLFDPAEAGVTAKVLIVLEAPGPMTNVGNRRPGSGFISVDNDDRTAENSWNHRQAAGLNESMVLAWNIVPWYIGIIGDQTRKPNRQELADGAADLLELIGMMPDLKAVVLAGRFAQRGWTKHLAKAMDDGHVIKTWHPSPLALNSPIRHAEFEAALLSARSVALGQSSPENARCWREAKSRSNFPS